MPPLLTSHSHHGSEFFAFRHEAVPATANPPVGTATGYAGDVFPRDDVELHGATSG